MGQTARIGAKTLVLSLGHIFLSNWQPRRPSLAEIDEFSESLNQWGEKARAAGVKLAYHNHGIDGLLQDGFRPLDRILERTDPSLVYLELDLAWAYEIGYPLLPLLEQTAPRLVSLHWKDLDRSKSEKPMEQVAELGEGEMGILELIPRVAELTDALPMIEVEGARDGMATAEKSYRYFAEVLRGVASRSAN